MLLRTALYTQTEDDIFLFRDYVLFRPTNICVPEDNDVCQRLYSEYWTQMFFAGGRVVVTGSILLLKANVFITVGQICLLMCYVITGRRYVCY